MSIILQGPNIKRCAIPTIMIIIIITIIIINIPRCETLPESALCKEGLWEVSLLSQVIIIITIINIVIIMKHFHDYHHPHHQLTGSRHFAAALPLRNQRNPGLQIIEIIIFIEEVFRTLPQKR